MTSLRSHLRQHLMLGDPTTSKNKTASRIPTKNQQVDAEKPPKVAQPPSKLVKRPSKVAAVPERYLEGSPAMVSATSLNAPGAPTVPTANRRFSGAQSSAALAAHRLSVNSALPAPPVIRTPSLVSGSSVSTFDSPRSVGLRRKPSEVIDRYVSQRRNGSEISDVYRSGMHGRNIFDDSVLGISVPQVPAADAKNTPTDFISAPYDRYNTPAEEPVYRGITPSTYAMSATPSTRYSESPFSHVPTPSSMSSYSPAMTTASGASNRPRPSSPTRIAVSTGRKASLKEAPSLRQQIPRMRDSQAAPLSTNTSSGGLAPVRESSTSSSNSNCKRSTIIEAVAQESIASEPNKVRSKRLSKIAPPTVRALAQVPPELAHLNVEPVVQPAMPKNTPPVRPSRDGTPDLAGIGHRTHVVQSDLPLLYTTYHKRTPSQETPTTAPSPSVKSRFGFSPKSSSLRDESPRIDSAISPPPASVTFSRGSTPDIPSDIRRRDSPAIVPSSPSKRFGFFSRKTKPEIGAKVTEKPKRAPVKGPAAGTGHEGYYRFGLRGRSGSSNSVSSVRSPSADSTSSYAPRPKPSRQGSLASKASSDVSDMDDFFKERLKPVILRGSGSAITRTASAPDVPSTASPSKSTTATTLDDLSRPQLLPSAMQKSVTKSPSKVGASRERRPSDSSEDGLAIRYPTRLKRTSVAGSSLLSRASSSRIPPPIDTGVSRVKQSLESYDAEASTLTRTDSRDTQLTDEALHGREGLWLRSATAHPAPPRKLNFLQRALAKGKGPVAEPVAQSARRGSSARSSISTTPYAMLDSVQPVDLYEVGRMVAEAGSSTEDSTSEPQRPAMVVPYENRHVSLLPAPTQNARPGQASQPRLKKPTPPRIKLDRQDSSSPELLRARPVFAKQTANLVDIPRSPSDAQRQRGFTALKQSAPSTASKPASNFPQHGLSTPELGGNHSPKQPRLSPIGRIPKVISKRDRDRKLPDNSFSRPFARHQPRPSSVKPPGSVYNQIREMASPIENGSSSSQPVSSTSGQSEELSHEFSNGSVFTRATTGSTNRTSMDIHMDIPDEFLAMPRKTSDVSSSTSSGHPSWQFLQPQQEDIWNEYNDFIDEVMPMRGDRGQHPKTPTTGSSLGAPFQYANVLNDSQHYVPEPFPYFVGPAPTIALPMLPGAIPVQSALSVPQQVTQLLHPSLSPMTPDMIMSLIGGYDRTSMATTSPRSHRASMPVTPRSNVPQQNRTNLAGVRESMTSSRYSCSSTHSRAVSLPGSSNGRDSAVSPIEDERPLRDSALYGIAGPESKDPSTKLADLRRSALLTAKWLSFGQVLFSPAHHEVRLTEEPRVLVVDGLNSDWSYFLALSYTTAAVYNLHLPHHPPESWPDIHTAPPPNHRSIPQAAISASFPFPKGFFTAVVLRFPPAASEPAYAACIAECKRVLRPGGFLEVAALELDLAQPAPRARQAVRGLKTRLQQRDPSLCLRNASDVFVRLIGRRGFESVQRCIVGVPVSGRGPRSLDGSSAGSVDIAALGAGKKEAGFSFGELMQESMREPGQRMDDAIGRMVSKVGRWWYSACYERASLPGDRSIWRDAALLKECEREGTTFRLLICHAQKPAQVMRRTVSV